MGVVHRQRSATGVQQLTSHTEVNQENTTTFEPDNQILPAAIEGCDPLARELGGCLDRVERPGKARVGDLDALQAPADELRLEVRANRLDLG